jgi:hypothetical protein
LLYGLGTVQKVPIQENQIRLVLKLHAFKISYLFIANPLA